MEHSKRTLREYWVTVRIDGDESVIRRVADSPESATREFMRDLHRGGRQQYDTEAGKLTVEWGNIGQLRVGAIVRVIAIVPGDEPPGRDTHDPAASL